MLASLPNSDIDKDVEISISDSQRVRYVRLDMVEDAIAIDFDEAACRRLRDFLNEALDDKGDD